MIKHIFAQKATTNGSVGARLMASLKWWRRVLTEVICERKQWDRRTSPPCRLFVDAANTPARGAAVLFEGTEILYTEGAPGEQLMSQLMARNDKQITSLVHCPLCLRFVACISLLRLRKSLQLWWPCQLSLMNCRAKRLSCILIIQEQKQQLPKVRRAHSIIMLWCMKYGPMPSGTASTCGLSGYRQSSTSPIRHRAFGTRYLMASMRSGVSQ